MYRYDWLPVTLNYNLIANQKWCVSLVCLLVNFRLKSAVQGTICDKYRTIDNFLTWWVQILIIISTPT